MALKTAIDSFAEEVIGEVPVNRPVIVYDGFEPSGKIHIAQAIMRAVTTGKMVSAGAEFIFLVADRFAKMNHKLGGDDARIRVAGLEMIRTWRAVWKVLGIPTDRIRFVWSSDVVDSPEHRALTEEIASRFTVARFMKCMTALGKTDKDVITLSQLNYACMQCADVFALGVDVCSLGMDQRKINMLAVEFANATGRRPPTIVSHHMLSGLDGSKMSKSNPDNAIFMDDTDADIVRKIRKSFCEPGNVAKNPCLELVQHIILPASGRFKQGDRVFGETSFKELEAEFASGAVHPVDFKNDVVQALLAIIQPIREELARE